MKIVFYGVKPNEKEVLKKSLPNDNLLFFPKFKFVKDLDVISIFVGHQITEKVLSQFSKLKLIATRSTGFDHIDLGACKKRGIVVCNVPTYGENTVAEHTFALMLALSRKIVSSVRRTKEGSFDYTGLMGFDLREKTLGVIGGGNIGQHVIRMAKGFDMKVLVFDLNKDLKLANKLGFKYVAMNNLLKNSDIITLHVPYNKHTHHLINKDSIAKMKKGVYIINTSRGGVIDTDALVKSLKSKHVAGAGLDVLEVEKKFKNELEQVSSHKLSKEELQVLMENHILLEMPNVLITPHNAFNTNEALMRILKTTIDNIKKFKRKKLVNVVKFN